MTLENKLERAEHLASQMKNASVSLGRDGRSMTVRGVDENELKKIYGFLCKHKSVPEMFRLIDLLINSPFARRSKRTEAYYRNAKSVLEANIQGLSIDESIYILGWGCRLMKSA